MTLPLWLLALTFFSGMLLAHAAGCAWRLRTSDGVQSGGDDVSIAAVMGLLSLLLGFTFSLCMERYEARRQLVIAESNALESVWLRASLLEPRDRDCLRSLLRDYLGSFEIRVGYATCGLRREKSSLPAIRKMTVRMVSSRV